MKKVYLLLSASVFSFGLNAQNAIPNGNFESWTSTSYDNPVGFYGSSLQSITYSDAAANCIKVADPYHGSYAVQLQTVLGANGDTSSGYFVNSMNPNGNNPCLWTGGTAYNQIPTGIKGYYKSNIQVGDSAMIVVAFRNGTTCLGLYGYKFYGMHNSYTPFEFQFNPPIAGTPDTMIFAAASSDIEDNIRIPGSMFQLDSISFTGATQTTAFNGDFENWQTQSLDKPNNWYLQTNDLGQGVLQTTDKQAGNYAVEIQTIIEQRGQQSSMYSVAQAGGISTGYYPSNCSGPCTQMGGNPFSNQIDTLCFYYKYAPSGNDTAAATINFKYQGNNVWTTGSRIYTPASTYQYMEIPFNVSSTIDTVIVGFNSSIWSDSSLSYLGTTLKIDEVHFKSQPLTTGIQKYNANEGVNVYPNPSADGMFTITNVQYFDLVRIYNVYGQEINAQITKDNGVARVQINNTGAYLVYVNSRGKITSQKIIVNK